MKITTSFPELVFYKCYSDCTVEQAILNELIEKKTLTLPDINRIRVNWNSLVGSYWSAIRHLRKKGYNIETKVYHDRHKHITKSSYTLLNPTFSWSILTNKKTNNATSHFTGL